MMDGGSVIFEKANRPLNGSIEVPGDKSISHRMAILASLAKGTSRIDNIADGEDVKATLECLKALGIDIYCEEAYKCVKITGRGLRGYIKPNKNLYAANSATTMRILSGVLVGQSLNATIAGDESLINRPMGRIIEPLKAMGANIGGRNIDGYAPIDICGSEINGINYELTVPSAQVKSCLLFAGLFAKGSTSISGLIDSRDHTERLFEYSGIDIIKEDGMLTIGCDGMRREPNSYDLMIPGDISSAAFFITLAAMVEGSCIEVRNVGINPTRMGFVNALKRAGADIEISDEKFYGKEPVGNISVRHTKLSSFHISESEIPSMIDEIPLLAIIATQGSKMSIIEGVGELRVKESDRVEALVDGLRSMGADIKNMDDTLIIGPSELNGARIDAKGDHRIAMACAIASQICEGKTEIVGFESVNVSYPNFESDLRALI